MPRWSPVLVAVTVALVLLFGLGYVLQQNLRVAPWAEAADVGRHHPHLKNLTRFAGDRDAVRRAVHLATALSPDPPPRPASLQAAVDGAVRVAERPRHAVVLPNDLVWALPGAYWAAYAGVPVVFAGPAGLSGDGAQQLARWGVPAVVLAPPEIVPDEALGELPVPVRRVAGRTPAGHAVRIAETRHEDIGFGWGRTHFARFGYFHYVLAAPEEAATGLEGLPLATTNAATFLFLGDDGGLPPETDRYLWAQRADWFVTPSETPFRHLFVLGDRPSYAALARADLSLEKAPYAAMGPVALGPMEALAVGWIALGLASGLFVLLHGMRLLPQVMLAHRLAWALAAALLPVFGVWLYASAWRRPAHHEHGALRFARPPAIQAAAATVMGFGYGAPLMIFVGYLFVWYGFPLWFAPGLDGWQSVVGAGMPIMMAAMYVLAVLVAWPLVQVPMRQMLAGASARRVALTSLGVTALSMATVSLGMMTTAWILLMYRIPMMPKEDEILWFGAMWFASAIGFLIAWPLNAPLVGRGLKPGEV
jgi:hypothetical protein